MELDCVGFLQWALPHVNMRWAGFRKVRKQVCKRVRRRMKELDLVDYEAYRKWLTDHTSEWDVFDTMCRIPISRFYRDWAVFDYLKDESLPQMAIMAQEENRPLRIWSAGCASGEEPYTLSLIWNLVHKTRFPEVDLQIIATDIDEHMLHRAKTGCYSFGSLKGLPREWVNDAFTQKGREFCIQPEYGDMIQWLQEDIRQEMPEGVFDLVLCRNLVAMYFDTRLQHKVFERIRQSMRPGAILVLGCHEKLPEGVKGLVVHEEKLNVYRKNAEKK